MTDKINRTKKQKTKTRKNRTRSIYRRSGGRGEGLGLGDGLDFSSWINGEKKTHHKRQLNDKNKSLHSKKGTGTDTRGFVLGKVSVSWCGHCQDLVSIWEKMMEDKRIKNSRIEVVDIDHESDDGKKMIKTLNHEHGVKINVNGYPTIFKIYGRKLFYFPNDKERTADNIIKFAFRKH